MSSQVDTIILVSEDEGIDIPSPGFIDVQPNVVYVCDASTQTENLVDGEEVRLADEENVDLVNMENGDLDAIDIDFTQVEVVELLRTMGLTMEDFNNFKNLGQCVVEADDLSDIRPSTPEANSL
ncbi:uncharacterized protein LOC122505689 [Leptopilina heterotoma]|uniref:uncharacterized protein LOC122505689 n=1 Tax=Leptopilina heterotoma TaxID=63436 RepID=UPI001CA92E04|nr:uncharacterized protein LOC122505689 [Leptopilina heterotoma]